MVFSARPPFGVLKVLETGPITNHVNIVRNAKGRFAYVTVGGLNAVLAFRTETFEQVAKIPVGELPHGIWPSGDGTRVYVGIENADAVTAIDTLENNVIATIPTGQAAQALVYVPNTVPEGPGTDHLVPLGRKRGAARARTAGPQSGNPRLALRPGFDAGAAGRGDGPRAQEALPARAVLHGAGRWTLQASRGLQHQPGGRRHRQRRRPDPAVRAGLGRHSQAIPGDRQRHARRSRRAGAGPAPLEDPKESRPSGRPADRPKGEEDGHDNLTGPTFPCAAGGTPLMRSAGLSDSG